MSHPNRKGNKPTRIGRYEVLRKIATGGMAELFLAKKMGMDGFEKVVAIKQILSHLSHEEEFVNMFRDEARIVAKLSHPNIVQIFDLGKSEDSYFIAMEYIPGRNLSSVAKRAKAKNMPLEPVYIARCMAQACEGLYYAHNRKEPDGKPLRIVHRDVSPQNIILAFSGQIKIVDFGIAKAATKIAHTRHGVLKGKYAYMSPEQIRGEKIDARSDLFAVGVVLYELLCGKRPFEKENSIQTLKSIVQEPHEDPGNINSNLAPDLVDIINRCLVKKRDDRFQTAQEIQIALEDYVAGSGMRSSNLAISQWLNDLFAEDLQKAKGSTVVFKGVGEVILPDENNKSSSSESKQKEGSRPRSHSKPVAPSVQREAQSRPITSSKPPPEAPSVKSAELPRGRGGGSLNDRPPIQAPSTLQRATERRASTQGHARANLIQEGVISGSPNKLPPLPDAYSDDATAIAPDFTDSTASESLSETESPTILPEIPKPKVTAPEEPRSSRNYSEGTREGISKPDNESGYDDGATEFGPSFMDFEGTAEEQSALNENATGSALPKVSPKASPEIASESEEESAEEIAARVTDVRAGRKLSTSIPLAEARTPEADFEEIQVSSESSLEAISLPSSDSMTPEDPFAEPSLPRPEMANVDVDADSRTMATADYEAFEAHLAEKAREEQGLFDTPKVEIPVVSDVDPFEDQLDAISVELRRSASQAGLEKPLVIEQEDDPFAIQAEDDTTALPAMKKPSTPPPPPPPAPAPLPRVSTAGIEPETLPPGTPSAEQLIPPTTSEPKSAHPNAKIGSSQVPPANVSLSEMLCEPTSPPSPALARAQTPGGMPAPQLPGASLQAHNDLPAPEPLNLADSPAARPARGASVAKASAARTIKERSRDDSNERVLNPAQVQLIANEPAAQQSVRRHARMAGAGTGINTSSGVPPSSNQNTKAGSKFLRVLKIAFLTLFFISVGAGVFVALLKLRVPTLIIKTTPPGARVILDGKIQEGATPLEVQVTPGQKYRLRIISEGYEEHIVIVRVQDSINAVKYDLVPESKKKAPPGSAFPETP